MPTTTAQPDTLTQTPSVGTQQEFNKDGHLVRPASYYHYDADLEHGGRYRPPSKGFYGHIGNPGILGFAAHSVTLMLLSTQFMRWRGVGVANAFSTTVWFFAGLQMFAVAQWCLVKGETFAYCVFGTFSGFYLSYAAILTPGFGVAEAFAGAAGTTTAPNMLNEALALYLFIWGIIFTLILIVSLRTNMALVVIFFGAAGGVWLLASGYVKTGAGSIDTAIALNKAGGAFLFLSASSGFYMTFAQLADSADWPIELPMGDLSHLFKKRKAT